MTALPTSLLKVLPDDDVLTQCMHCGLCLAACPTYDITKLERSSPRGRIRMVKAVAEGTLVISRTFYDEMNFCLDCQACETACPAGVKYGHIVEGARELLARENKFQKIRNFIKTVSLNYMLGVPAILRVVSKFLSLVQRSGFITFISRRSVVRKLFPMVVEMTKLLPDFSGKNSTEMLQNRSPVQKGQRFKVAFLTGCLMDTAFAEVNVDTVELLEKLGCEVIIPPKQYCCGSLHAHYGENQKARKLAQKNVEIFDTFEYDFLVANSAGCGAYMKEYGHLFAEVPGLAEKAQKFSSKVLDLFEFLLLPQIELRFREWKSSLTYHDACHLCHTQKMFNEPRKVLAKIPGLDYRSLPDSTRCCGSAGIYNIMRYPDSMQFLEKKMMNIANTGAENVLTANPGCFLQIKYGAEKFNRNIKVLHPASLLNSIVEQAQNKIG